jgi:hypothetical protein
VRPWASLFIELLRNTAHRKEVFIQSYLYALLVFMVPMHCWSRSGAETLPLPPSRPTGAPFKTAPNSAPQVDETKQAGVTDRACVDRLDSAGIEFDLVTLSPPANPACAVDTPVKLKSIFLDSRTKVVRLPDGPTLSCSFSERLSQWIRELVAPLIAGKLHAELKAVRTGPGYECRNRNHAEEGKISAHAFGIAIDVTSVELADNRILTIGTKGDQQEQSALDTLRVAACGWFTTVLGPGSDAAHANHLHIDNMQHGTSDRYRICQ